MVASRSTVWESGFGGIYEKIMGEKYSLDWSQSEIFLVASCDASNVWNLSLALLHTNSQAAWRSCLVRRPFGCRPIGRNHVYIRLIFHFIWRMSRWKKTRWCKAAARMRRARSLAPGEGEKIHHGTGPDRWKMAGSAGNRTPTFTHPGNRLLPGIHPPSSLITLDIRPSHYV